MYRLKIAYGISYPIDVHEAAQKQYEGALPKDVEVIFDRYADYDTKLSLDEFGNMLPNSSPTRVIIAFSDLMEVGPENDIPLSYINFYPMELLKLESIYSEKLSQLNHVYDAIIAKVKPASLHLGWIAYMRNNTTGSVVSNSDASSVSAESD